MDVRVFLIALMLLAGSVQAAEFKAGVDYEEVPFPQPVETGNKIEVREFFWYGCPHCYDFEPTLRAWVQHLPKDAAFIRTPAVLPRWEPQARLYYALEVLGVADKLHQVVFDAIHRDGIRLNDAEAMADFVAKHGVDRAAFLRAFNSFGVNMKLRRAQQMFEALGLNSVPTIVIDGRYRTSPSMAKTHENTVKVVEFLIKKAAAERRKK
jgi:thiol:disulfide interchange protein DsbA